MGAQRGTPPQYTEALWTPLAPSSVHRFKKVWAFWKVEISNMNALYFFLGSDQVPLRYSVHPAKESIPKLEIDSFARWALYLRGR